MDEQKAADKQLNVSSTSQFEFSAESEKNTSIKTIVTLEELKSDYEAQYPLKIWQQTFGDFDNHTEDNGGILSTHLTL